MVALQVRDVSDAVRDLLAEEAQRRGQSLQVFLLHVLEREAASASNRRWIEQNRTDPRRPRAHIGSDRIVDAIEKARESRGA